MASIYTGKIDLVISIFEAMSGGYKTAGPARVFSLGDLQTTRLANGTGSGQADKYFAEKDTALAASTAVDRDFAGSLVDTEGATITFVKVKLLMFYNSGTTSMTIKGKAANIFALFTGSTDALTVGAGSCLFFFNPVGITVAAGSTDQVTITNSSGSTAAAFSLIVGGTSA